MEFQIKWCDSWKNQWKSDICISIYYGKEEGHGYSFIHPSIHLIIHFEVMYWESESGWDSEHDEYRIFSYSVSPAHLASQSSDEETDTS